MTGGNGGHGNFASCDREPEAHLPVLARWCQDVQKKSTDVDRPDFIGVSHSMK